MPFVPLAPSGLRHFALLHPAYTKLIADDPLVQSTTFQKSFSIEGKYMVLPLGETDIRSNTS
jgi:hypothetical protein